MPAAIVAALPYAKTALLMGGIAESVQRRRAPMGIDDVINGAAAAVFLAATDSL